jgi:serine protease Do
VRLAQIDRSDLNTFEFDYDLTFMVFFLNADEKVYARYGGRVAQGPDERQSLAGLRHTMQSVLATHSAENKQFAPRQQERPLYIRDIAPRGAPGGGCIHCHQVRELMDNKLKADRAWTIDQVFRYPPPENLGLKLEVDRGNVVEQVAADSPAARVGLQSGDVLRTLNEVPIHSYGDAQFALDRAPKSGSTAISWQRGDDTISQRIELPEAWRRSDISWRSSVLYLAPFVRLYGFDLTDEEKKALGLSPKRLAFRHEERIHDQAKAAGIQPGDIILGVDDLELELRAFDLSAYVRCNYVKGEVLTVNVIRKGEPLRLTMTLLP